MERIGLADSIQALRAELSEAMLKAEGDAIQFPVGEVHLDFQVGVTKDAKAKGEPGSGSWNSVPRQDTRPSPFSTSA